MRHVHPSSSHPDDDEEDTQYYGRVKASNPWLVATNLACRGVPLTSQPCRNPSSSSTTSTSPLPPPVLLASSSPSSTSKAILWSAFTSPLGISLTAWCTCYTILASIDDTGECTPFCLSTPPTRAVISIINNVCALAVLVIGGAGVRSFQIGCALATLLINEIKLRCGGTYYQNRLAGASHSENSNISKPGAGGHQTGKDVPLLPFLPTSTSLRNKTVSSSVQAVITTIRKCDIRRFSHRLHTWISTQGSSWLETKRILAPKHAFPVLLGSSLFVLCVAYIASCFILWSFSSIYRRQDIFMDSRVFSPAASTVLFRPFDMTDLMHIYQKNHKKAHQQQGERERETLEKKEKEAEEETDEPHIILVQYHSKSTTDARVAAALANSKAYADRHGYGFVDGNEWYHDVATGGGGGGNWKQWPLEGPLRGIDTEGRQAVQKQEGVEEEEGGEEEAEYDFTRYKAPNWSKIKLLSAVMNAVQTESDTLLAESGGTSSSLDARRKGMLGANFGKGSKSNITQQSVWLLWLDADAVLINHNIRASTLLAASLDDEALDEYASLQVKHGVMEQKHMDTLVSTKRRKTFTSTNNKKKDDVFLVLTLSLNRSPISHRASDAFNAGMFFLRANNSPRAASLLREMWLDWRFDQLVNTWGGDRQVHGYDQLEQGAMQQRVASGGVRNSILMQITAHPGLRHVDYMSFGCDDTVSSAGSSSSSGGIGIGTDGEQIVMPTQSAGRKVLTASSLSNLSLLKVLYDAVSDASSSLSAFPAALLIPVSASVNVSQQTGIFHLDHDSSSSSFTSTAGSDNNNVMRNGRYPFVRGGYFSRMSGGDHGTPPWKILGDTFTSSSSSTGKTKSKSTLLSQGIGAAQMPTIQCSPIPFSGIRVFSQASVNSFPSSWEWASDRTRMYDFVAHPAGDAWKEERVEEYVQASLALVKKKVDNEEQRKQSEDNDAFPDVHEQMPLWMFWM